MRQTLSPDLHAGALVGLHKGSQSIVDPKLPSVTALGAVAGAALLQALALPHSNIRLLRMAEHPERKAALVLRCRLVAPCGSGCQLHET